ncbi:MAG TPA: class I SAM-dependent methyltransferase, partial [Thermoleophilaceae bacterium]
MSFDATAFRAAQRAMWSTGDWPDFAKTVQPVSDALIERVAVRSGQDVLDVGTGSGNAALRAAERGARVVGLDITPELFDAGRKRAAAAGVEIEWVEGDATQLPFPDDSFDVVVTVFGAIFAPRHQPVADEFVRVCRPGGTIAVCGWTPEGLNGRLMQAIMATAPPPPPGIESSIRWGEADHVAELFEGKDVELSFERELATWEWESPEAWVTYLEQNLGPAIMAKAALEPSGAYAPIRAAQLELFKPYVTD